MSAGLVTCLVSNVPRGSLTIAAAWLCTVGRDTGKTAVLCYVDAGMGRVVNRLWTVLLSI